MKEFNQDAHVDVIYKISSHQIWESLELFVDFLLVIRLPRVRRTGLRTTKSESPKTYFGEKNPRNEPANPTSQKCKKFSELGEGE